MGQVAPEKNIAPPGQGAGEQASEEMTEQFAAPTLGERLTPLLLLIGEICVVYAILLGLAVTIHFAGDANPLLPFWGLLLLMLSFYLLDRLFQQAPQTWLYAASKIVVWLLVGLGFTLMVVWLNNYAQSSSFFSFAWFQSLITTFVPLPTNSEQFGSDTFQVDITPAVQTVVLLLLTGVCSWRSYRLGHRLLTSTEIDKFFKFGSVGIMSCIVLFILRFPEAAPAISPLQPALIAGTFCMCVLSARSLAHASYMRRFHGAGLWGSAARQERIILQAIGLLVLVAVVVVVLPGSIAGGVAHVTPYHIPRPQPTGLPGMPCQTHNCEPPKIPPASPDPLWGFVLGILLSLMLLLLGFLSWRSGLPWLQRKWRDRTRKRATRKPATGQGTSLVGDETRESLWNWSLFLAQVKATLLALLLRVRLFRRSAASEGQPTTDDLHLAEPAVRSIREVYRALLKKAASRGHLRGQDETPYEFWRRLEQQQTLTGPELEQITRAYVLARYSGTRPGEGEVARVKHLWSELKRKWL